MSQALKEQSWWSQPISECRSQLELGTNHSLQGLSDAQAAERLTRHGHNVFRSHRPYSLWRDVLMRFKNPLVTILIAASVIAGIGGDVASCVIIIAMVMLSVSLDVVQEHRATRAAEQLKQSVAVQATVWRNGRSLEIPIADVVRGDIVLLGAGDLVPADGLVIEAKDLFVKQGLLTGESYPVEKHAGEVSGEGDDLQSATNALFMGTSIVSGMARMLVMRTGAATEIGAIADVLEKRPPPTAFELGVRQFGLLIMRVTSLLVLIVLLINTVNHRPLLESFLFAVALAVGLTPELLPMVVTVTLSYGARRMAQHHVIVKRLSAIHDLGSMDVLCTDKTGTLTEAKISLERHVDGHGQDSGRVLELAYLNSIFESGLKSPLDEAIVAHGRETVVVGNWTKIDEVPFDFERRRVSVLIDNGTLRSLVVKGAPDDLLPLCTQYEENGAAELRDVDDAARDRIKAQYDALSGEGLRVLAIAWRHVAADHPHAVVNDEAELIFAGYVAFLDPPKQSAALALAALAKSGVTVKILTGDNELVAQHICRQLNIPVTGLLTGAELRNLDDYALRARAETANLFCRMNPAQKDRVIIALKAQGHVVGYLGDGINDAPSLHSADVGLSVACAADVAKEAADIVLLEEDLQVIHDGIIEGRRTFANIMKYIMMGTSSNFGNMFSMAGASLLLKFLPMLPTQILLNNMLYDISEIAIPWDQVDDADLVQPHKWDMRFVRNFMFVVGPVSSLFDFITFYILLTVLKADEALFQTGWFIESLATQVLVIFVIRTRGNPLKSRAHPALVATSLTIVAIAALLPFTPIGGYFGFVQPPARFYLILLGMAAAYIALVEFAKRVFYRHSKHSAVAV